MTPDLTTNVFAAIAIKSSRMQVRNFTMLSMVDRVKVNNDYCHTCRDIHD
jgi:hypothetical protein